MSSEKRNFSAGVGIGVFNTVLFNPVDKAMYKMNSTYPPTGFLDSRNWKNPYSGVTHAVWSRIISYGLYYPFLDFYKKKIIGHDSKFHKPWHKPLDNWVTNANAGILTGITTAALINPLNLTKSQNWNKNVSESLFKTASKIYIAHGWSPFMRGLGSTISRDSLFGAAYAILLHNYSHRDQKRSFYKGLLIDTALALPVTCMVSPINYVRNERVRADLKLTPPTVKYIVEDLIAQTNKHTGNKVDFVLRKKFGMDVGSLRVALGMGLSRQLYVWFTYKK